MERRESGRRSFAAGAAAGAMGTAWGHPLDTLKVRTQTAAAPAPRRLTALRAALAATGGARALWRGVSLPLLTRTFVKATLYGAYGEANAAQQRASQRRRLAWWQYALSGGVGGAAASVLQCPAELIKIRLQLRAGRPDDGPLRAGLRAVTDSVACPRTGRTRPALLWRGIGPTVCREVSGFGVYFAAFEEAKRGIGAEGHPALLFCVGGCVGSLSWCVQLPSDVVKSRLQADPHGERYRSAREAAAEVLRDGGMPRLWAGLRYAVLRAWVVHGTTMAAYESLLTWC